MGTANRPALGRAEVALTIDNSSGKLATDLAEITITRTLFRSGDSEYSINGAACRLLDIQELLSDTGVGRQQHVIISQGHLDAILEARPEDRRAVIEEAAGVLKYRRRRERSERRLASTEENLERLFDLVREVKRQIRPLERQAAAARSYTGLADELRAVRLYVAGSELRALDRRHAEGTRPQDRAAGHRGRAPGGPRAGSTPTRSAPPTRCPPQRESDLASALGRTEGMVERARGLTGVSASGSGPWPRPSTPPPTPTWSRPSRPRAPAWPRSWRPPTRRGRGPGPRAGGARRGRGRSGRPSCEAHQASRGDGAELRTGRRGGHRGPGAARLPRARPRARPPGAGPALGPPGRRPSDGPRCSRARTTSWASAWPRRSRPAIACRPRVAETEAAHGRATAPAGGGRGGPAPGRAGAPPVAWPGPTPWSGPSTRPGVRPGPSCWPASTGWSAPFSTWSRWTPGGRTPSRPPPVRRWRPWWCRAASRPGPHWPGCARVGPPGPCWPSPGRGPPAGTGLVAARAAPPGTESIRGHVRPRHGGRDASRARRRAGHAAGRVVLRPRRLVRGHRPGPGPSRPGGGHPRR